MRSSPFDASITPGDHVGLHPEPRQDAVVDAVGRAWTEPITST